jgi:hypothetical protein
VLARRGRNDLAVSWEEAFTRLTRELADLYVTKLDELEQKHGMRLRTVADLVHERFVRPLALDRLCALIAPAMNEARRFSVPSDSTPSGQSGENPVRQEQSFARLQTELQPLTAIPTGVGLDIPHWLRRLGAEIERVRLAQSALAVVAEGSWQVARRPLALEELERQVEQWDQSSPGQGETAC